MIYLLLSILSSTGIFILFKLIDNKQLNVFNIIVINYFIAAILGFILQTYQIQPLNFQTANWIGYALVIGILFLTMFYILGLSSQKAGVTKTTISAKLSAIIPIVFSILIDPKDQLNITKILGITTTIIAITFTVYKQKSDKRNNKVILLPIVLFIGMGIVDSLVKYSQSKLIQPEAFSFFTAVLFLISGTTGLLICFLPEKSIKSVLNLKSLQWGIMLGITNFGSIYFLLKALSSPLESSIIFGINNLGIILLCTLIGILLFKEKTSLLNKIGIALSFAAIFVLSFA